MLTVISCSARNYYYILQVFPLLTSEFHKKTLALFYIVKQYPNHLCT